MLNTIINQVHYFTMLYNQSLGYKKVDLPLANVYNESYLSLQKYPRLTVEVRYYVINRISEFCI